MPATDANRATATEGTGGGDRPPTGTVVGLDGSSAAEHAYRWACRHADRFGPVSPVAVWRFPWWYALGSTRPAALVPRPDFESDVKEMIDTVTASTSAEHRGEPIIAHGPAGPILVDVAADHGLLVVGTKGRTAAADTVLGSITSYCTSHSPVPTVVVPEGHETDVDHGRVVVGLDGSPPSVAALDWALAVADPDDEILVVHAWHIPEVTIYRAIAVDADEVQAGVEEATTALVDERCARAGVDPERVSILTPEADARAALAVHAEKADLVVVGRRSRGGPAPIVLGSVASALVHRPAGPIVIVPPPVETA